MKKEFVMRGQTASGGIETLHFSGFKEGYAYRMTELQLYPSTNIGGGATADFEASASVTAGKVALNPAAPDFNNDSLIATALFLKDSTSAYYQFGTSSVVNDTFMITQDLLLEVHEQSGNNSPVNWQCRFESVKLGKAEQAVVNYKQFTISDI